MSSTPQTRRFRPPWTLIRDGPAAFAVQDANGVRLVTLYCRDDLHPMQWADYHQYLTSDEARRIAKGGGTYLPRRSDKSTKEDAPSALQTNSSDSIRLGWLRYGTLPFSLCWNFFVMAALSPVF